MSDGKKISADLVVGALAVIVIAGGVGWFVLGGDQGAPDGIATSAPVAAPTQPEQAGPRAVTAAVGDSAQVTLNKARMALNADMLAEPPGQNALYFYSLALESDPDNVEIQEELAAVAETVSGMIRGHIGNGDLAAAESLAARLELAVPNADAVDEFRQAVAKRQSDTINRALRAARDGDDALASRLMTEASDLPLADAADLAQARRQISELSAARAAAAERAAAEQAAAEQAARAAAARAEREEPDVAEAAVAAASKPASDSPAEAAAAAIRERISAGELFGADSAATDLRAARQAFPDAAEIDAVERALVAAIEARTQREIAFEQLVDAEDAIEALTELGADAVAGSLSAALNDAYIRREGARVIPANDLELVEAVAPIYPKAALRRDQEGWVEVEFTVNRDGRTENIEVIATADTSIFNRATIQAVQQWQFEPRIFRGQPIDQRVMTRVIFQLTDS